jgi:hypothetical protein
VRLLTDENFNGAILRGLMRRLPKVEYRNDSYQVTKLETFNNLR